MAFKNWPCFHVGDETIPKPQVLSHMRQTLRTWKAHLQHENRASLPSVNQTKPKSCFESLRAAHQMVVLSWRTISRLVIVTGANPTKLQLTIVTYNGGIVIFWV
jgi:hypothetical protein